MRANASAQAAQCVVRSKKKILFRSCRRTRLRRSIRCVALQKSESSCRQRCVCLKDFELGQFLRDNVIDGAVIYYTEEASEDDDQYDFGAEDGEDGDSSDEDEEEE